MKFFYPMVTLPGIMNWFSSLQSQVSSPTIIVERAGSYAWTHKSWRVREEFVRTLATAVGLFASTELLLQRVFLSPVCQNVFSYLIWNLFFRIKKCSLYFLAWLASLTASFVLTSQVLQLLNDLNQSVREAAISCIQVVHYKPLCFSVTYAFLSSNCTPSFSIV
jgi:hypothetical protein